MRANHATVCLGSSAEPCRSAALCHLLKCISFSAIFLKTGRLVEPLKCVPFLVEEDKLMHAVIRVVVFTLKNMRCSTWNFNLEMMIPGK